MSIIIRLQNLPWSANALDIRQFFNGLQIPEGGVHIVGGELGDAFIAFSTDEDARQAFLRTDGKIKGIQIKLMLSSRTEMQRVIEQARTQSMAAFMLPTTPAAPVQVAQPLPAVVPQMLPAAVPELKKEEKDDDYYEKKRERRRSRSKSRDRRDRSRERRRYRDRSRSKSRDRRDNRRRGRDRSKSRNRNRDTDGRSKRDRARIDTREDLAKKSISEVWSNAPPSLNIIPPINLTAEGNGLLGASPWEVEPPLKDNTLAVQLQARALGFQSGNMESWPAANPPSIREPLRRPLSDYPKPPVIGNMQSLLDEGFRPDLIDVREDSRLDFRAPFRDNLRGSNYRDNLDHVNEDIAMKRQGSRDFRKSRLEEIDTPINACVALEPFYGSYGDLRRFFFGLGINYRGIKIINDDEGHKTGICFVQFRNAEIKSEALNMNGQLFNGNEISVKHITDKAFQEAVDRYQPRKDESNIEMDHFGRSKTFRKLTINEPQIKDFVCLKVEDLPTFVTQQEIMHVFAQHPLICLHLDVKPKGQTVAYVQFSTKEVAKLALDNKVNHVIRGKPVTVKPCTNEEFEKIDSKQVEAFQEPKQVIETDCLSVSKLPVKTTDRNISDFFSDIGVIPEKIHLISSSKGFTGLAYCEFVTKEEAAKGATKDNTVLGQNNISVRPIPRTEMEKILGSSLPHPGISPGQTLMPGTPLPPINPEEGKLETKEESKKIVELKEEKNIDSKKDKKIEIEGKSNKEETKSIEEEQEESKEQPDESEYPGFSQFAKRRFENSHLQNQLHFEAPRDFQNARPFGLRPPLGRGPLRGRFNISRGGRFNGPGSFDLRDNFHGPEFILRGRGGSRFMRRGGLPPRFDLPRSESPVEDDIPGCTVYMENIPFKAGTNEILDFFQGYNCSNNVSRRYNPNNTPTGDAKVAFYEPSEAFRAVEELNGKKIWNRSIYLRQE